MAEKEYIERYALIEEIRGLTTETWGKGLKNGWWSHSVQIKDNFLRLIEKSPAADVAPVVHARWKDNHCTACGMMPMGEELWDSCEFAPPKFEFFMDYCPHCGARMDGGKDG
jgi:hypothetical protein